MIFNLKNRFCYAFLAIILTYSCQKNPVNKVKENQIKQSNHLIEDNVNGKTPPPNNVIESTNFFYNKAGTLDSATVYNDTTPTARLLKKINLIYFNNKVVANTYLDSLGFVKYTLDYNDKKQVTSVRLEDSSGLYITYFNDRISNIKILPGGDEYIGFIYDDADNLLQYSFKHGNQILLRIFLEYDNSIVTNDFDSRFLSKEIKFIYIGGLNLTAKLGLNYGKTQQNKLIRRTEVLASSGQIYQIYEYGYTQNRKGDIIKRNIMFSTDTLYYQFKY